MKQLKVFSLLGEERSREEVEGFKAFGMLSTCVLQHSKLVTLTAGPASPSNSSGHYIANICVEIFLFHCIEKH